MGISGLMTTQQGNGCALLPIKLMSGVNLWGFLVRCDFGASLCMGLARYPFMLSEDYLKDHVKHIYRHPGLLVYRSYHGLLYQDGKQLSESLDLLGWGHLFLRSCVQVVPWPSLSRL